MFEKSELPSTSATLKKRSGQFTWAMVALTLVFGFVAALEWYEKNWDRMETQYYAPIQDVTFRDWAQDENGLWSAAVFINKTRSECVWTKGQIVTLQIRSENGSFFESLITFVGDESEDSNRPSGWQRLDDRVRVDSPRAQKGDIFRGAFLHGCHTQGKPIVSEFGPAVIGEQDPWPPFVLAWMEAGRPGFPEDFKN